MVLTVDAPEAKPGDMVTLKRVRMLSGDLDQNGCVLIEDIATATSVLDTVLDPRNPAPTWRPVADITNDNSIDVRDTTGVFYNYRKKRYTQWTDDVALLNAGPTCTDGFLTPLTKGSEERVQAGASINPAAALDRNRKLRRETEGLMLCS